MAVDENYVKLEMGIPVTMKFDNFKWISHKVVDPDLGFSKTVRALVFHVIEVDGEPADTVFSLISTKAQREMEPYLAAEKYKRYKFTWLKEAPGYVAPRLYNVIPLG